MMTYLTSINQSLTDEPAGQLRSRIKRRSSLSGLGTEFNVTCSRLSPAFARLSLPLDFSSLARFFRSPPTTESLEQAKFNGDKATGATKGLRANGPQTDPNASSVDHTESLMHLCDCGNRWKVKPHDNRNRLATQTLSSHNLPHPNTRSVKTATREELTKLAQIKRAPKKLGCPEA